MKRLLNNLGSLATAAFRFPQHVGHAIKLLPMVCAGRDFASRLAMQSSNMEDSNSHCLSSNVLWDYFRNHNHGRGIWKWEHYFEIYHRHFSKFINQSVDVLEIGVQSGGSLEMWRAYFGAAAHIYGVDIKENCRIFASDSVTIHIGNQADRRFWKTFKSEVHGIDIIIDDGGHTFNQQRVTLEEMLPQLRPGGVYVCEDVHGTSNKFAAFAQGLVTELNSWKRIPGAVLSSSVSTFQREIHSIHFYPYMVVIEKNLIAPEKFIAPKQGNDWQ
jgi:hypothetical protein